MTFTLIYSNQLTIRCHEVALLAGTIFCNCTMGVLPMVCRMEELNGRKLSDMCSSQFGQAAASFKMHLF